MAAPAKAARKTAAKPPAKKTAAKRPVSSARVRGRGGDAVRDMVEAAAELASGTPNVGQTAALGAAKIMDVNDAAQFAANLPDKFLDCRLGKHLDRFADFDNHGSKSLSKGWSWRRYCPRCKFEVTEHFDSKGMKINHDTPHYAEGYLAPKGGGRVDSFGRGQMRIEKVKRAFLNGAK